MIRYSVVVAVEEEGELTEMFNGKNIRTIIELIKMDILRIQKRKKGKIET